jgi:DNA-binding transcriptional MerR regulator
MSSPSTPVDIPNKAAFKPAEVCDLLGIPTYVLRTWENEFADLGVAKSPGATRSYRRRDVELALRIRELVFAEHLTLAGVRRRLEQEELIEPTASELETVDAGGQGSLSAPVREKITQAKLELRELLQQLAGGARHEPVVPLADSLDLPGISETVTQDTAPRDSAKKERSQRRAPDDESPVLPGLGTHPVHAAADEKRAASRGKLDPSALNFASVSSPPPPASPRRRPGKSSR